MLQRLSAQTAFTAKREKPILVRLKEVALNPFSDWRYSDLDTAGVSSSSRPGSRSGSRPSSRNSDRISPTPASKRAGSVETEESSVKKLKSVEQQERKSPSQTSAEKSVETPKSNENTKSSNSEELPPQAAFAAQNLENLAIFDAQGDLCCECKKNMT